MRDFHIETPRLILRPMETSDLEALLEIFGDPKVVASFDTEPFDRKQVQRWMQPNLEHQETYGYGLFSVIEKAEGMLIGDCGLEHMHLHGEPVTELGYDFRSDRWNQGYATEAASAVRDYAFGELGIPSLISLIRVGNQASRRVAEKVGMRLMEEITINRIRYWHFVIHRRTA
ncbi:MAG TPA: GNAT family N-acetyltransferase [Anaerolineae bacterium]|nr:GNAT family N-acetyltransferase [Anaerolineae bacterium]